MTEHGIKRHEGYERIAKEIGKITDKTPFSDIIKERFFRAWDEWKPDYEGWLKWSDGLYAPDAKIIAIGEKPQDFHDYQKSMKGQRDAFSMDMGEIENCVVEKDTIAISYKMYMTAKADYGNLKKGVCYIIKVTEFNTFSNVAGYKEPMVTRLDLIATGFEA